MANISAEAPLARSLFSLVVGIAAAQTVRTQHTHGYQTGDSVLQQFAIRVSGVLRSDGYLIRWGGEEFLVVIRGIAEQDVLSVAERLRNAEFRK